MIEQQARVISASPDRVVVRIGRLSGCTACDAGKGCGAGVFSRLLRRRPVTLELDNSLDSGVGQQVVVGLHESLLLRLVSRLYLYPLLAGLAGAVLGHYITVRMGAGAAMVDIAALIGAGMAGAAMLARNRKREIEFPAKTAVHVMRHTGRNLTNPCTGQMINEQ